jgi:hypothetical protein
MKTLLTFLLAASLCLTASAQLIIPRDTFNIELNGKTLQIVGAVVQQPQQLAVLDVPESRYPLFVMRHDVAKQYFKVQTERDAQHRLLLEQLTNLRYRDTLNSLEITKLRGIHDLQQQHIGLCEAHNERLNGAITSLDAQLTQTRELARDCNNSRKRRQTTALLLGGGIGFGLGALLGIIAAK